MLEKVLQTIKKHSLIVYGDTVIVGLSGGPDSVCLLHLLHTLRAELGIRLHAVHINHKLRGEESDRDEEYAGVLCSRLGIPCHTSAFDVGKIAREKGVSTEEAGRDIRYAQFRRIAEEIGAHRIAVAHNKNDQAETVLMHIIRGTGLDGLKGMLYKRGSVIRPLLDIERRDIEAYCRTHGLNPRTDSSNTDRIFTRNKIRLDLIPYMDRLFATDMTGKICGMSHLIAEDGDWLESCVESRYGMTVIGGEKDEIRLDLHKLADMHPAAARRILRKAVGEIKGDLKGIEDVHIENLLALAIHGKTGGEAHLPAGLRAARSYDRLKIFFLREARETGPFEAKVKIPGTTEIKMLGALLEAVVECDSPRPDLFCRADHSLEQFFDYDGLKEGMNIRNRRNGDVFKPFKSNGTKKLKEYFIDRKIPREERDGIPLIAKGNEVVWMIGYKISDKFKVTENTKCILKLRYLGGEAKHVQ